MKRAKGISRGAYEAEREFAALVRRMKHAEQDDNEIVRRDGRRQVLALVALSIVAALLAQVIRGAL